MSDPAKRSFVTEHGKEMNFYPDEMSLVGSAMASIWGNILVSDDEGVSINSPKPIYITAKEDVVMESPALDAHAVNGELVTAICDTTTGTIDASVTQSNVFDLCSATTNAEGRTCVEYEPYDDAPEEEKFDVWELVGHIIAGVVAVAIVAAVAFAAVSLLGPFVLPAAAAAVHTSAVAAAVGAGIGGGMAVGFQALSDIKNHTVSSLGTYVYKGIGGGVSGAVTGALGPEIFNPMKKLAYIVQATVAGTMGGLAGGGTEWALNFFIGQEYDYGFLDVIVSVVGGVLGGFIGGSISAWVGTTAQKAMNDLSNSSRSYIKNYLRALLSKKGISSTNEMIRYLNQLYDVSYGSINAFKSIIQNNPAPLLSALKLVSLTITNAGRESLGSFLVQLLQLIAPEETENLPPSTSCSEGYISSID